MKLQFLLILYFQVIRCYSLEFDETVREAPLDIDTTTSPSVDSDQYNETISKKLILKESEFTTESHISNTDVKRNSYDNSSIEKTTDINIDDISKNNKTLDEILVNSKDDPNKLVINIKPDIVALFYSHFLKYYKKTLEQRYNSNFDSDNVIQNSILYNEFAKYHDNDKHERNSINKKKRGNDMKGVKNVDENSSSSKESTAEIISSVQLDN